MTTKEQERKALEQIKKIVASLGEDSYIATAFEGCFEIAAENIENDFACSMKQRKEAAEAAEDSLREKLTAAKKELADCDSKRRVAEMNLEEATQKNNSLRNRAELAEQHMKLEAERANRLADKNKLLAQTIIELKAKLYDYMTK